MALCVGTKGVAWQPNNEEGAAIVQDPIRNKKPSSTPASPIIMFYYGEQKGAVLKNTASTSKLLVINKKQYLHVYPLEQKYLGEQPYLDARSSA
jgi:hypothetical protein